jgi:hypothetical protein
MVVVCSSTSNISNTSRVVGSSSSNKEIPSR